MSLPLLKSFSKQSNKPLQEVEDLYNTAKEIAKSEKEENNYPYIISILKNMLGLNYIEKSNILNFNEWYLSENFINNGSNGINEIRYVPDGRLVSLINDIATTDDKLGKLIYEGIKYSLYQNSTFFTITNKENEIVFYQKYVIHLAGYMSRKVKYYQLMTRENVSKHSNTKGLFKQLVYSLLLLGFPLRDDNKHNLLSYKSIVNLFNDNKILVQYCVNDNDLTIIKTKDELDNLFNNSIPNVGIYYSNYSLNHTDLLEAKMIKYKSRWQGYDLFDDITDYIN